MVWHSFCYLQNFEKLLEVILFRFCVCVFVYVACSVCVCVHMCMGTHKFMQLSKSRSTSDKFVQMSFAWDSALNSSNTPSVHPFSSFHPRLLLLSHGSLKLSCFQFISLCCSSWVNVTAPSSNPGLLFWVSQCCSVQPVSTVSVTSQLYESISSLWLSPSAQPLWL